jgi:hypothetical protein
VAHKKPKTVTDLVSITTVYADSDRTKDESDEERWSKKSGKSNPPNNNDPPKNNKRKSDDGGSELVANTSKGDGKTKGIRAAKRIHARDRRRPTLQAPQHSD